jgi:hypothetical protein
LSYSVYAVAAAEFMTAFYERLFAGDPVSAAVTSGRKRMATRNKRPSRRAICRWKTGWSRCTICAAT